MAIYKDYYLEEVDGKYIEKPLLVTVSLEEYRSLIQENETFRERINYLENRLLEETEKRLKEGADNAE
jgi:hypothetical protein